MSADLTTIADQMITSLKVTATTTLKNAARGQIKVASRYPVAELRFYGGGEIIQDFNSIFRAPLQAEILIRGKSNDQVLTAIQKVLVLWTVGGTAYAALRALDAGFYDIAPVDWQIPDERQVGAEVKGYILYDMRVEFDY